MTRYRRVLIALTALIAVAAMPSVTGARSVAVPGVPPIVIPTIPGSETARFKVVVEGTAKAVKREEASAALPCVVAITSRVEEVTTYERGRGVVMEFVTLGPGPRAPIVIQRVGRSLDASLALTITTVRTSTGTASRQNPPGGGVCDPRTEDLSQGPDCGKPDVSTGKSRLLYDRSRGSLSLEMRGLGSVLEIDCPASELLPGVGNLKFGWPLAPKLPPFALRPGVIFGTKKVILLDEFAGPPKKVEPYGGVFSGTRTDFGSNRAKIRLVRVK